MMSSGPGAFPIGIPFSAYSIYVRVIGDNFVSLLISGIIYVIFWWILLLPTRICFTDYELWTTSKFIQYTGHRCCEYIPCYLKISHSNIYNELYCHCGMKIYFSICCNVLQHYIVILHYYVNPLKLILSNMPYIVYYTTLHAYR